ncbi:hypothetical protein KP509_14G055600 [Ceratopteris richardii]|uniref:Uncharacterized protein n=1 Tax=Ceratopteris richardii TaxID=49495 RepID=A0A8T2T821_CERRI|nr:hypothetical protein KP509_14G055600 [Ceratopteris richardii]
MGDQGKFVVIDGPCKQTNELGALVAIKNEGQLPENMHKAQNTVESHNLAEDNTGLTPTVGAFTVQCAKCMKWRFIPTKEYYEEIRQTILEKPFFCSSASEWRPDASCSDPLEISPDMHDLWAFDKPGIPLPPKGWERLLVIRPAGSSKFADIYYVTPSGKKLRSAPEVDRFLSEHPEYVKAGVNLSQFSFIIPRPLDGSTCKKRGESLFSAENPSNSQRKTLAKSKPHESHHRTLRLVRPSFKGGGSRKKLEKFKFHKKAITEPKSFGDVQSKHSH